MTILTHEAGVFIMIYGTKNAMNVTMDVIVVIKNVATIIMVKAFPRVFSF